MKTHPVAEMFPMLSPDELDELAENIRANGLQIPLFLDHSGEILVDGRNRLRACEIAGVEPTYRRLDQGADLVGFIMSANISRRHMTKGQNAMIAARARAHGEHGTVRDDAARLGISAAWLSQAITVLDYTAPAVADSIIAGALPLAMAYEFAKSEKDKYGLTYQERLCRRDRVVIVGQALGRAKARLGNQYPDYPEDIGCPDEVALFCTTFATCLANEDPELPDWLPRAVPMAAICDFVEQAPPDFLLDHPGTHLVPLDDGAP
jgi:hypothetical protein